MRNLKEANEYLKNKKNDKCLFRPFYHMSPDYGWCNDPHGVVYFKGQYHIFFQYNPYDTKPEQMTWGHMTTNDFVHFSKTTCAIVPDMPYDNSGCWSGSSIVIGDTLYVVYTGFSLHDDGKYYQTICLAESKDGINFIKSQSNPIVDTKDIPNFASIYDFRDPCVFERNNRLYLIIGNKTRDEKEAELLLYEGEDIKHFHFKKVLVHSSDYGTMFECPSIFTGTEKDYIIMSPQNLKERDGDCANTSSNVYFPMDKDFIDKDVSIDELYEIDHGTEFYAATVYDKESILLNWFQMWGRRYYLDEIGNDFVNSFSLFKKIKENKNHRLSFQPMIPEEFITERKEETFALEGKRKISDSRCIHHRIDFDMKENNKVSLTFFGKTTFTIDKNTDSYTLDRSKADIQLGGVENTGSEKGIRYLKKKIPEHVYLDIYIDQSTTEIFFDDYEESFSFLCFDNDNSLYIESKNETTVNIVSEIIR